MKSIRKKITVCLMATVIAALVLVGSVSIALNYRNTVSTVDRMLSETAILAAERIGQELTAYKNVAMDTGCIPQLSDASVSVEEKRAVIDERVSMHGFQRGNIVGLDGISIFDGNDYSTREYVQQAMQGNVYVSEPLVSKITGELSIMVAAPIYADGARGSQVAGVVYFVPPETFLNDIVSSIKVSENCRAYMINKSGDTIADTTLETITTQNIEREAQSDASLKGLAAIHAEMRQGKSGFDGYNASDGPRYTAYAPVDGTDGWSVAVTISEDEFLHYTYMGNNVQMGGSAALCLAVIVISAFVCRSIAGPIVKCAARLQALSQGDGVHDREIHPVGLIHQEVGVFLHLLQGFHPVAAVEAKGQGQRQVVAVEKVHQPPHPRVVGEALGDLPGLPGRDAPDLAQALRRFLQHRERLSAEARHDPLRRGRPHLGQDVAQQSAQLTGQSLHLRTAQCTLRGGADQDKQLPAGGGIGVGVGLLPPGKCARPAAVLFGQGQLVGNRLPCGEPGQILPRSFAAGGYKAPANLDHALGQGVQQGLD